MPNEGTVVGSESSLSNWVGPYVTDMLGEADALTETPYTPYQGPLTAGASDLQSDAFGGLAGLTLPSGTSYDPSTYTSGNTYDPTAFNLDDPSMTGGAEFNYDPYGDVGSWTDSGVSDQYMSPYIRNALMPQLDEMNRQSEIQRNMDAGRLTMAGAFGGSRQAIMDSERTDNNHRLMTDVYGTGMQDAYESGRGQYNTETDRDIGQNRWDNTFRAGRYDTDIDRRAKQFNIYEDRQQDQFNRNEDRDMDQFNAEEERLMQATQNNRGYGLDALNDMLRGGATQRGIDAEGIAADRGQFENERDYPYRQLQFKQSMLQGLPTGAQSNSYAQDSGFNQWIESIGGIGKLWEALQGLGG